MPNITPEEARHLLNADSRSTHGPGTNCHTCKAIRQHAREMMHQIAGMTYEYAAQVWSPHLKRWLFMGSSRLQESARRAHWHERPQTAECMAVENYPDQRVRVVARVYSQPVPVSEEA